MKKVFAILIVAFIQLLSFGQITTTKVAPRVNYLDNSPYDSTQNFLGEDVKKYIGQDIYLNGMSENLRKYGYDNFSIDYNINSSTNESNIYKCCDGFNSKYDELAGRYFIVLDVIKHPKAEIDTYLYGKKFYLKLQEKETKDIVYYQYDSHFKHTFPFIVVGYFNKLKQTQIGKEFVVRGKNWISSGLMTDMKTGYPVSDFVPGGKWKCVDVTIEERFYTLSLVLENTIGEKIPLSIDNSVRTDWVFGLSQAELYKNKFGIEDWQRILEGKVRIGMTKEMCELSWGKPKSTNETIVAGNKSEQWVYVDNYLYFENGILKAIQ